MVGGILLRRVGAAAARPYLPPKDIAARSKGLTAELAATDRLLEAYAHDRRPGAAYLHLTLAPWQARRMLGLPPSVDACVFNLDGVLVGSAALHLAAWTETFDEFISRRIERTGGRFAPFNPRTDYPVISTASRAWMASARFSRRAGSGSPRAGWTILPARRRSTGSPTARTRALRRRLDEQGLTAFEGSRRYLETARDAELRCAVISASANTNAIVERSGLAG